MPAETVSLGSIIDLMEAKAHVSMIFIDACRNNPLAQTLAKESTRAISRGLAPVEVRGDGTMIAFAATPGQVAYDGTGKNSAFTSALVAHLGEPGLEIGTAFKRVIQDVRRATDDRQSPQIVSSVAMEIYLGGENPEVSTPATAPVTVPGPPTASTKADEARIDPTVASSGENGRASDPEWGFDSARFDALAPENSPTEAPAQEEEGARSSPEAREAALNLSEADIAKIQSALVKIGYDLGSVDGSFGTRSRSAIRSFQVASRVPQTGYLDDATIEALLATVAAAPIGYEGKWQLVIYREWLVNDRNYAPNTKGTREILVSANLEARDNRFFVQSYNYQTIEPTEPFSDFNMTYTDAGRIEVTGLISTHFRDRNHEIANMRRLSASAQMPNIVPLRRAVTFSANRIDGGLKFYVSITRVR